jgi:hypothetical protein
MQIRHATRIEMLGGPGTLARTQCRLRNHSARAPRNPKTSVCGARDEPAPMRLIGRDRLSRALCGRILCMGVDPLCGSAGRTRMPDGVLRSAALAASAGNTENPWREEVGAGTPRHEQVVEKPGREEALAAERRLTDLALKPDRRARPVLLAVAWDAGDAGRATPHGRLPPMSRLHPRTTSPVTPARTGR